MSEWPKIVITMDAQAVAAMNNLAAALNAINPLYPGLIAQNARSEELLVSIAKALGDPVDSFRWDALAWNSTQAGRTATAPLEFALSEVMAGRKPPWVANE